MRKMKVMHKKFIQASYVFFLIQGFVLNPINATSPDEDFALRDFNYRFLCENQGELDPSLAIHVKQIHSIKETSIFVNHELMSELSEAKNWLMDAMQMREKTVKEVFREDIVEEELNNLIKGCERRLVDLEKASLEFNALLNKQLNSSQFVTVLPRIILSEDEEIDTRTVIMHNLALLQLQSTMMVDDIRNQYCLSLQKVMSNTLFILRQEVESVKHGIDKLLSIEKSSRENYTTEEDDLVNQNLAKLLVIQLKQLSVLQEAEKDFVIRTVGKVSRINANRNEVLNQEEIIVKTEEYLSTISNPSILSWVGKYIFNVFVNVSGNLLRKFGWF